MKATRHPGRLIVLEGVDGSGKSTLQRLLAAKWRAQGWKVGQAREPADRSLGRDAQVAGVADPWTSAMLFTLDRMIARPRLQRLLETNDLVLMDRSYFSTLAYQGSALPTSVRKRLALLQRRLNITPDRVVLLDLPARTALLRLSRRGGKRAPLERLRTLERVARAYRAMARPPRWLTVDATGSPPQLVELIDRRLRSWRGRPGPGRPPGT
jgi:dTMP kinase